MLALISCLDWQYSTSTSGSDETWTWTGGRSTWSWLRAPLYLRLLRGLVWSGWISTSRAWQSRVMARREAKVKAGSVMTYWAGPLYEGHADCVACKIHDAYYLRSDNGHGYKTNKRAKPGERLGQNKYSISTGVIPLCPVLPKVLVSDAYARRIFKQCYLYLVVRGRVMNTWIFSTQMSSLWVNTSQPPRITKPFHLCKHSQNTHYV